MTLFSLKTIGEWASHSNGFVFIVEDREITSNDVAVALEKYLIHYSIILGVVEKLHSLEFNTKDIISLI